MPCWDDVGESKVLRRLDFEALKSGREKDLFSSPELVEIRSAYSAGREPFPDLCSRCAVRGHGQAKDLRPQVIEVLHIEPSFLCHLACPQCVPLDQRKTTQSSPFNMPVDGYEALLRTLLDEGVNAIRFVHFEGRGDPLMHRGLGDMIRITKQLFPSAFTKVTTHGNYPFHPWILDSGLDVLRFSIDGAHPESYSKYRVGGDLNKALGLMREVRDQRRDKASGLRTEWKYILFEWNDSAKEMRAAARLADELEADLRFCLTHSPGRSKRVPDMATLDFELARLGIRATRDLTFQLKRKPSAGSGNAVVGEHCAALLKRSLQRFRSGDRTGSLKLLSDALRFDPGLECGPEAGSGHRSLLLRVRPRALDIRYPSTASTLANLTLELGDSASAEAFFRRYLDLAPEAADRTAVEEILVRLIVEGRLGATIGEMAAAPVGQIERAQDAILRFDPGGKPRVPSREGRGSFRRDLPETIRRIRSPRTLLHLAFLRWYQGDPSSSLTLISEFLARSPRTRDHFEILQARRDFKRYYWRSRLRHSVQRLAVRFSIFSDLAWVKIRGE